MLGVHCAFFAWTIQMKRTFTLLLISIFSLCISGCDVELPGSESSDKEGEIITITSAPLIMGSEQHYEVIEFVVSDKKPPAESYVEKTHYSMIDSIPQHSGYQASGEGPFLVIEKNRYGNLNNLISSSKVYANAEGKIEFSADKDSYANQDDSTFSSERDSSSMTYQIGKSYKTQSSNRRYDNYSHILKSSSDSEAVYTPSKREMITTASGTYDALKIDFSDAGNINNTYGNNYIVKAVGSQWLDIKTNKLVKLQMEATYYNPVNYGTEYEQSVKLGILKEHILDKKPGKTIETQSINFLEAQGSKSVFSGNY